MTYRLVQRPPGRRYAPCPWCGGPMKPQEFEVTETTAGGWQMTCSTRGCEATGPRSGPDTKGREEAVEKNERRIAWPPKSDADQTGA